MNRKTGPVVAVSAPANGSGKTSLLCRLIEAHPGPLVAVKSITIYRNGSFCPVLDGDCACRQLTGHFDLIRDPTILHRKDTDTERMFRAGAREVFWGLAREGHHAPLWEHLRKVLPIDDLVLLEGTQILQFAQPRLRIFVFDPTVPLHRFKASASRDAATADLVILNRRSHLPETPSIDWLREIRTDWLETDLSGPMDETVNEILLGRISAASL